MNRLRASADRRWRVLVILALALVLSMSTWFSATAVIPQLRDEWRLPDGAAAWLTIAVQLGFVAGALLSSVLNLSDVLPVRSIIIVAAVSAAVVNLFLLVADGAWAAVPLRFLTGAFLAGLYPPALKLMATWFKSRRGMALGVMVGALTLGSALPHLVNALGGLEWRTVIAATSILTAGGAMIVWLWVSEGPHPFPPAVFDVTQARQVFRNRAVVLTSLGYFGHMWELYAMWAWFIVFFRASLAANGAEDGAVAAAATFGVIGIGAFGCGIAGAIADRWGRARVNFWSLAASGACAVGIGLAFGGPSWLVLAIALVWGFAIVADSAQYSTLVTEHADQRYIGTALTLQLAGGFLLTVVTIWLMPWFERAVTWRWAFLLLVPGPLVGMVAMQCLERTTTRHATATAQQGPSDAPA